MKSKIRFMSSLSSCFLPGAFAFLYFLISRRIGSSLFQIMFASFVQQTIHPALVCFSLSVSLIQSFFSLLSLFVHDAECPSHGRADTSCAEDEPAHPGNHTQAHGLAKWYNRRCALLPSTNLSECYLLCLMRYRPVRLLWLLHLLLSKVRSRDIVDPNILSAMHRFAPIFIMYVLS